MSNARKTVTLRIDVIQALIAQCIELSNVTLLSSLEGVGSFILSHLMSHPASLRRAVAFTLLNSSVSHSNHLKDLYEGFFLSLKCPEYRSLRELASDLMTNSSLYEKYGMDSLAVWNQPFIPGEMLLNRQYVRDLIETDNVYHFPYDCESVDLVLERVASLKSKAPVLWDVLLRKMYSEYFNIVYRCCPYSSMPKEQLKRCLIHFPNKRIEDKVNMETVDFVISNVSPVVISYVLGIPYNEIVLEKEELKAIAIKALEDVDAHVEKVKKINTARLGCLALSLEILSIPVAGDASRSVEESYKYSPSDIVAYASQNEGITIHLRSDSLSSLKAIPRTILQKVDFMRTTAVQYAFPPCNDVGSMMRDLFTPSRPLEDVVRDVADLPTVEKSEMSRMTMSCLPKPVLVTIKTEHTVEKKKPTPTSQDERVTLLRRERQHYNDKIPYDKTVTLPHVKQEAQQKDAANSRNHVPSHTPSSPHGTPEKRSSRRSRGRRNRRNRKTASYMLIHPTHPSGDAPSLHHVSNDLVE